MMWLTSFVVVFGLACCLSLANANPSCPALQCRNENWCKEMKGFIILDTYFHLKDKTQCAGCKRCIADTTIDPAKKCPPIPCPEITIPKDCKSKQHKLRMMYKGNECHACSGFYCQ